MRLVRQVVAFVCLTLALAVTGVAASSDAYNGYDQSGSCYSDYEIMISSCEELKSVCSSRQCSNVNGEITFSCSSPYSCSGVAAPATPAPTPVTAESMDCINGRKLNLKTCATKSAFQDIGCTCFTCNEVNGHITLACTAPFACSNDFNGENYVPEEEAPKLKTTDYVVICIVYAGVAGALVAVAWVTSPKKPAESSPPTQSMCAKAASFCNPANLASLAIQKGRDAFSSYFIEPNVRSDGQQTMLCEFWASENIWVALLSQTCCCCCSRPRQPPPNYKPPMIMSRAFGELMAGTFITFSLAFLVGTVVNNSEGCRTVIDGSFCQQGGVTQSIDTTSSTSNGQCQSVDVGKTTGAAVLTTVLTKVVSIAGSYAESMAKDDAKRKSMLLGGRLLATLALLGFGIGYSYAIASSTGDKEMANRRFETIGIVLGPSWAADQVTDMISVWAQRVGIYFVQCRPKQIMGIKAEQAAGSIVRPVERPLEPPQLDTMVHETDIQVTTAHN